MKVKFGLLLLVGILGFSFFVAGCCPQQVVKTEAPPPAAPAVAEAPAPPPAPQPAPPPPPPAPPQPAPPQPVTKVFEAVTLFDFNKAILKPQGKERIRKYREEAKARLASVEKIKITGYTDSIGSEAYNKKLSLRRADAVRNHLVKLGVDPNKMEVTGMGKSNPVASNKTKAGRAKNRRVEVVLTGLGK